MFFSISWKKVALLVISSYSLRYGIGSKLTIEKMVSISASITRLQAFANILDQLKSAWSHKAESNINLLLQSPKMSRFDLTFSVSVNN